MSTNKHYVYEHWRLDKGVCFYVGKGQKRRAWDMGTKEGTNSRNRWHRFLIKKLLPKNLIDVRLVFVNLEEGRAFELERERISYWRACGIKLVNLTDGGEGATGVKVSDETRRKISQKSRGRRHTSETRAKMSLAAKGNKRAVGAVRSPEYLAALSARSTGRVMSPEAVEKMRLRKIGRKLSDEHKAKIKAAVTIAYQDENVRKKCAPSPEAIEKGRLANLGKKQTPEHIAKKTKAILGRKNTAATLQLMSESHKRVWAEKKSKLLSAGKE